ncbi:MAG: EAL domain-containing protein [Colwellia sp.]|nr:EAL domain-containing protein [Colwellia sp.]MCW8865203.1 EAL domain-containing protein [Colwellia sp.]MCW9081323.1 EAL domain-containing protein [Colwellia sp.]
MAKIFISVPTKLLTLIISTLLFLAIGFSMLSLSRLQEDYQQYQQNTLDQGQAQFELHSDILRSKLTVWIESFAELTQLAQQDGFEQFSVNLAKQFDGLQLQLNVENLWLVDGEEAPLFITSPIPAVVQNNIEQVLRFQQPQHQIYCQKDCQLLLSLPLLNRHGEVVVVTMSTSMVDMLYAINTSLNSDVAVLSFGLESSNQAETEIISASNMPLAQSLLDANQQSDLNIALKHGIQIDLAEQSYLINLLSLAENDQRTFYLSLIDDVTPFEDQHTKYRQQFLLSLTALFIVLSVFVYSVARPFTKRLLRLSNALPLLANKKFDQFRQVKLKRPILFSDELDVLTNSALELSYELEQLNIEVEQKTKELENIAMYDLLTGLPNRNMLNYQLRKSISNIGRYGHGVAVLFLDLDDFKKVNDSNGHSEGDKLLIQAADRVRLSAGKIDLACRFGGDEFVLVLGHLSAVDEAVNIAEQLLAQFKEPIRLGSSIFYVSTSIGIAYTESADEKAEDLISHADIAMYEAKDNGGAQYYVYHQEMYQRVAHRVMLEGEVRQALAKRQFSLSLQPQLSAKSKKLFGFEALLRWQHPERGMISPEDFIPILENSQHMIELGYWIIHRCFELALALKKKGLTDIQIAINLSAGQFADINLPNYLQTLLDKFSLSAGCFELELTEQTLVKDIDNTIAMMDSLKVKGFSFAIDDFGTGYSSLAYLKKMPIDVIKVDKSFVFGMLENHADYQIIMSTIAMVKNLGLTVIAEGVETGAQLRSLTENDCDIIQGYYFSKPVPEIELFDFIENQIQDGFWKTKVDKQPAKAL